MYRILDNLTLLLAPIIAFTAEEIWAFMPHDANRDAGSVMFNDFPTATNLDVDDNFMQEWDKLHAVRDDVKKAIEIARKEKVIGSSLDAKVTVYADGEWHTLLHDTENPLTALFITSAVSLVQGEGGDFKGDNVGVTVTKAVGCKCARCWSYEEYVGKDSTYPDLCRRCAKIIAEMK